MVFVSVVFVNAPTVFRIVRGLTMDIRTRELDPALWAGDYQGDAEFRQYVQSWVSQLWQDKDTRIAELKGMVDTLSTLVACCHGDDRPDCPILSDLGGGVGSGRPLEHTKRRQHA